ncbi:hypothetical protein D3C83_200620 [compost metagenome]
MSTSAIDAADSSPCIWLQARTFTAPVPVWIAVIGRPCTDSPIRSVLNRGESMIGLIRPQYSLLVNRRVVMASEW